MTKHVLQMMDSTGHTTVSWDPEVEAEVETARSAFNDAIRRGLNAFYIGAGGKQSERMREFDPEAEKVVFIPQLRGG